MGRMLVRMPISGYFGGRGERVAAEMRKRYGKGWKRVFYATAAKSNARPGDAKSEDPRDARRQALKKRRHR